MSAPSQLSTLSDQLSQHKTLVICTSLVLLLAWRVRVAPLSPPPPAPLKPWERVYGRALVLAVRGNFFGTISYLYCCPEKRQCAVVDAAGHAAYLMKHAEQRGLKIVALLQTHAHLDHVQALPEYCAKLQLKPRLHAGDAPMLKDFGIPVPKWGPLRAPPLATAGAAVFAYFLGFVRTRMPPIDPVGEGDVVVVGEQRLRVLHVPGHTPGSCCFLDDDNQVMFSGDFLMRSTIGRSDLPGSDEAAMEKSLARVARDPSIRDTVAVLSGHTDTTTMRDERQFNPHLQRFRTKYVPKIPEGMGFEEE